MGTEPAANGPLAGLRGLMARPLTSYYLLLASSGLLLVIGLVMVFSATSVESYAATGNPYGRVAAGDLRAGRPGRVLDRAPAAHHDLPRARPAAGDPGRRAARRARRPVRALLDRRAAPPAPRPVACDSLWLYFGPLQVQPSELAKLALALWGAGVLAGSDRNEKRFGDLARTLFPVAGVIFLLVGYNDLGTMISMLILFAGLMFAAGVQMRVFGSMGAIALVGIGAAGVDPRLPQCPADRLPAPAAAL